MSQWVTTKKQVYDKVKQVNDLLASIGHPQRKIRNLLPYYNG